MAQQIRVNRLLGAASARAWTWPQSDQSHLLHVPLDGFAIDYLAFSAQLLVNAARTVEGPSRIDFVNAPLDGQFFWRGRCRLVVQASPRDRKQIGLHPQSDFLVFSFEEGQALTSAQGQDQIFF